MTTSRSCSACGKDGIGMTTKAGGLTWGCAPRQDVKKWSTSVVTRYTRESSEKCAYVRRRRRPSRQDGRRLTRDNQVRPTCARGGSRRDTRRTRGLSEIATGKRGRKVVALVDVRGAYFYASARRRVCVELLPEDYQPGDEHMCGLLHARCRTKL